MFALMIEYAGDAAAVDAVTSMLARVVKCQFGDAHSFLSIEIARNKKARTIMLNQAEHARCPTVKFVLQADSSRLSPIAAFCAFSSCC
eukprot:355842-Chlamydomonas_euryale.AAC.5